MPEEEILKCLVNCRDEQCELSSQTVPKKEKLSEELHALLWCGGKGTYLSSWLKGSVRALISSSLLREKILPSFLGFNLPVNTLSNSNFACQSECHFPTPSVLAFGCGLGDAMVEQGDESLRSTRSLLISVASGAHWAGS